MPRKLDISRDLQKRAEQIDPRRRELSGTGLPRRGRRSAFHRAWARAPTSWTPTATTTSTTSAPGDRSSSAMPCPRWSRPSSPPRANGTSFGASTPSEADLAELVISAFPHMQKVRFVSSGTEATMSAIRLARAYTKRKYIVKFEGCYHGHADALLVKAGSGVATLGIPGSAGVPEEFTQFTLALALQRHRGPGARLSAKLQTSDRLRDRRAGRRQHGMRARLRRLSRSAPRHHPARTSAC